MRGLRAHLRKALFLDEPRREHPLGRWEAAVLGAALLALAVVAQLARIGWSASLNSLWAEDGPIYMQEALTQNFWDAVTHTYATYLVVVPRLIGEGAALVPLGDVPAAVSILSAAVVALSGLVVWKATAAQIANPYLRAALAVLTVLCPVAGLESIDSAAYVPWFMLFASFWILLWRPAGVGDTVLATGFVLLTGLSTPGLWFFAPLAALRLLAARDRTDAAILGGYSAGALIQVPVLAFTDETAIQPLWTNDIWTTYLQRVVDGAPLGLRLGGIAWEQLGWVLLIGLLVAGAVGFAAGFRRAEAGPRWIAAVALPTSLAMFVVSLYQRAVGEQMVWLEGFYNGAGSRYAIVPALLAISAALVLIDSYERRQPRARRLGWASGAALAVLAVSLVASFDARDAATRGAPPWDAALEAAAIECEAKGADGIAIQTSPPGFAMGLPCPQVASFAPSPR